MVNVEILIGTVVSKSNQCRIIGTLVLSRLNFESSNEQVKVYIELRISWHFPLRVKQELPIYEQLEKRLLLWEMLR